MELVFVINVSTLGAFVGYFEKKRRENAAVWQVPIRVSEIKIYVACLHRWVESLSGSENMQQWLADNL